MYLTAKEVREKYKITSQTLHNWRLGNKIKFSRTPSGKILYEPLEEVNNEIRLNVIYARVTDTKQRDDLARQISVLREFAASNGKCIDGVYSDITSGMSETRKGFNELIDAVLEGKVQTIFVSCKDRLARFGFGYIESVCEKMRTNIIVVNSTAEEDFQSELTEDLISIIHYFSTKMCSNRKKELKELEKNLKNNEI